MAIGQAVERMDDRLEALRTALAAAGSPLENRVHKTSLAHYTAHSDAELAQGVLTAVSAGEKDYHEAPGMEAREGTQRVLLIGHLKKAEIDPAADVEAEELDLIEEIKTFVREQRQRLTGISLRLDSVLHSRQLEAPYGWVVAYLDLRPPRATTH